MVQGAVHRRPARYVGGLYAVLACGRRDGLTAVDLLQNAAASLRAEFLFRQPVFHSLRFCISHRRHAAGAAVVHADQSSALFFGGHSRRLSQGRRVCGALARSHGAGCAGGSDAGSERAALPLFAGCLISAPLRWPAQSHIDMASAGEVTSSNKSNKIPGVSSDVHRWQES